MENNVTVHLSLSDDWHVQLWLHCPLCAGKQSLAFDALSSGEEFVCDCGEDIHLSAATLAPVRKQLEELKRLAEKSITLPV